MAGFGRMGFADFLFAGAMAEALSAGRLGQCRMMDEPDNFFDLPTDNPVPWSHLSAKLRSENRVFAVEVTDEANAPCRQLQKRFVQLARRFERVLFIRLTIKKDRPFKEIRKDIGGVEFTPTIIVIFHGPHGTRTTRFEGVDEVTKAFDAESINRTLIEFMDDKAQAETRKQCIQELMNTQDLTKLPASRLKEKMHQLKVPIEPGVLMKEDLVRSLVKGVLELRVMMEMKLERLTKEKEATRSEIERLRESLAKQEEQAEDLERQLIETQALLK